MSDSNVLIGSIVIFNKVILSIIILFATGCASMASRPYACTQTTQRDLLSWMGRPIGNVFQLGDCAVSDRLRVEIGEYYRRFGVFVSHDIWKQSDKQDFPAPESIQNFAKAFNCTEKVYDDFNLMLLTRQEEIFGPKWKKTDREVAQCSE